MALNPAIADAYRNVVVENSISGLGYGGVDGTATAKEVGGSFHIVGGFGITLVTDTTDPLNPKVQIINTGNGTGALTTIHDENSNATYYPIFTRAPGPGDINIPTGTYQMDTMYLDQTTTPLSYNPGTATLTVANIASPTITGHATIEGVTATGATGTGKFVFDTAPTVSGGSVTGLTSFGIRDTTAAYDVILAATSTSATLTANRTVTIDVGDAARSVRLNGNLSFGGTFTTNNNFTIAGPYEATITPAGVFNATFQAGTYTLPKDDQTFYIGSTLVAINRASANLALTGITSVKSDSTDAITFDSNSTGTVNVGTSANAKAIEIGNNSVASTISLNNNTTILGTLSTGNTTITGTLTVNGTTTTINANTLTVDDKNIELGSIASQTGITGTISSTSTTTTVYNMSTTVGLIPGQVLTKQSGSGAFGGLTTITSVDSTTQITITSDTANTLGDITFSAVGASDTTAEGGGITIKGTTDKTILWQNSQFELNQSTAILGSTLTVGSGSAVSSVTSNGAYGLTVTTGGAADLTLSTNSGTNSGTISIENGANGNITLAPNGTGDVYVNADTLRVGDSGSAALIAANDSASSTLGLRTYTGAGTGTPSASITLGNGVNSNITIQAGGTGSITLGSDALYIGPVGGVGSNPALFGTYYTDDLTIRTGLSGTGYGYITIGGTGANQDIQIVTDGTGTLKLTTGTVVHGVTNTATTLTTNGAGALTVTTGGAADLTLSTNSGTNSGTITIANGLNGNITLTPNGTGNVLLVADTVQVGDAAVATTLTTNGAGALTVTTGGAADLTLSTNSGTNSGTITIANGLNGNITLTPNGTGDVYLDADILRVGDAAAAATITSNGAGALTVTTGGAANLTLSTNSGTNSGTITIANGLNGNITLTPNGTGVTSIKQLSLQAATGTGAGTAPMKFSSTTNLLATVEAGAFEYNNSAFFLSPQSTYRGVVSPVAYTSGQSASNGSTIVVGTRYAMFPAANDTLTLPVGVYLFEIVYRVDTTAAVANILSWSPIGTGGAVGTTTWQSTSALTTGAAPNGMIHAAAINAATDTACTITTSAAATRQIQIRGTLRITTAGTILPTMQWSGLAGVFTTYADNYMLIKPIVTGTGTSGTATIGGWG